jgi:putative flavoprotein involved in K+ transport
MRVERTSVRVNTVVVGGGQAGLSVGHHLARHGVDFVILDAAARLGDPWRCRWDSLRLFTPARHCGLDGMPFPAPPFSFPTKDEMADYLEAYAREFALPVRSATRVERLSRLGKGFVLIAGPARFEAENVVVAMSNYQRPRVPAFARDLDPGIVQLHSFAYRGPTQLRDGDVLVAGAGNSGAEIALELARTRRTWLAGRPTGEVPFRVDGLPARLGLSRLVLRVLFHRVLSVDTPIGRRARPRMAHQAAPLIRTKSADLAAAGVVRVPRVVGTRDGLPLVAEGRTLQVANVVWCTGFDPGFSWIDLPVFDADGEPRHRSGLVPSEPGLYFVGLRFLHAFSSEMIHGVGRDAARIAAAIAAGGARLPGATADSRRTAASVGKAGSWRGLAGSGPASADGEPPRSSRVA